MSRGGQPAFPGVQMTLNMESRKLEESHMPGLSIREYTAIACMNRCIEVAAEFVFAERDDENLSVATMTEVMDRAAQFARYAADALLHELAKPQAGKSADAHGAETRG